MGLLALVGIAGEGCDEAKSCKPGTVFVRIEPGSFVTANEILVAVSIDGGEPVETSRSIPTGSRGGGIEVEFPNGYPAGRSVTITVSLLASGSTLSSRSVTIVATGECTSANIKFPTAVTGTGGAADGGTAGAGGEDGGPGGEGGTGGSVAGAGGGPAGAGGVGGVAGAGGTGGTTGGFGGRGGTGGTAGTGGAAGRGGGGGTGGTGGMCQPTGAENCFNNLDDDCDGRVDCSDTDCTPTAQCVPLDPAGGKLGVVVTSAGTCPTGYTDMTVIYMGLSGGACTGCSCRVPTVTSCTAPIYSFGTAAACSSSSTQGTLEVSSFSSTQACTTPSWVGGMFGTILGVQAGAFTPVLNGSCTPQGTATPGPASWATTSRFCATTMIGGGCTSGQVCAPVNNMPKCTMFDGARVCQSGTSMSAWNTGATDTRMCGACSCGSPTGHGCSNMRINVGTDYTCSPQVTATVSSGQRYCYSSNGVYSPGIVFSGSPTQPTGCPASATASGSLTATGPKTVCCVGMPTTP